MKYMLQLRFRAGEGPEPGEPGFDEEMAAWAALNQEMEAAGVSAIGYGLDEESTATTVRSKDGDVILTDGPFAESKEHLFSFYLIEVQDLDEAIGWAKKMPCTAYGSVEVRPLSAHEQDQ
jgi:hypothetical protein